MAIRRTNRCVCAAGGAVLFLWTDLLAAQTPAPADRPDPPREITVFGQRQGWVDQASPELKVTRGEIEALRASTLAEIVELLGRRLPEARQAEWITLINGSPVSSFAEAEDIPSEAVIGVEIMGPAESLRLGYRANQRIINVTLARNFHAWLAESAIGATTQGGDTTQTGHLGLTRISGAHRSTFDLGISDASAISEEDRNLSAVESSQGGPTRISDHTFRDLAPASGRLKLTGTLSRPLAGKLVASAESRFVRDVSRQHFGLGDDLVVQTQRHVQATEHLLLALDRPVGDWKWRWTVGADHALTRDRVGSAKNNPVAATTEYTQLGTQLQVLASPLRLPAGRSSLVLTSGIELRRVRSRSGSALDSSEAQPRRMIARIRAGLTVPLSAQSSRIGALSVNAAWGLEHLSDFGNLTTISIGASWQPAPQVGLTAAFTSDGSAPSVLQLGGPVIRTLGVRVFDGLNRRDAIVTLVEGGQPQLARSQLQLFEAALTWKLSSSATVALDYLSARTRDPPHDLAVASFNFQAAFPERFARDTGGNLVVIDVRPVNFALERKEQLGWTLNLSGSTGSTGGSKRLTWQASLRHSMSLRDSLAVTSNLIPFEFFEAGGISAAHARHQVDVALLASTAKLSARTEIIWRSGGSLRDIGVEGARFTVTPLAVVDLTLSTDLGSSPDSPALVRGLRLALAIDNLFAARPRVRDQLGKTPLGLQPAYLDPIGRSLQLSLRKTF